MRNSEEKVASKSRQLVEDGMWGSVEKIQRHNEPGVTCLAKSCSESDAERGIQTGS